MPRIANIAYASDDTVKTMLAAPQYIDGRGSWLLITLDNGDVIFGCYPSGNTFEKITQSPNRGERSNHPGLEFPATLEH